MGTITNIWPLSPVIISQHTQDLIERFFDTSDSTDYANSGRIFAEEFFAEDAIFKTHETCVSQGRKGVFRAKETAGL
jgi:hypothetical protein